MLMMKEHATDKTREVVKSRIYGFQLQTQDLTKSRYLSKEKIRFLIRFMTLLDRTTERKEQIRCIELGGIINLYSKDQEYDKR
jgi:hypothetical protein